MSKLTKVWKRGIRPRLLQVLSRNVVPAPTGQVSAESVVRQFPGARYLAEPCESICTLPARTIIDTNGQLQERQSAVRTDANPSQPAGVRETNQSKYRDFAVLTPASIAGTDGAVISPNNELVSDVSGVRYRGGDILDPLSTGKLTAPQQVEHPIAVSTCWRSDNYYHWIIDGLARLRLLEDSLTPSTRLYAPTRKHFHSQSLQYMGFAPARVISAKYATHIASPNVLAAASRTQNCSREDCDYLHQRFTRGLCGQSAERILLSRRKRGTRSLINEREILTRLRPLGFRRVLLENLSFADQVKLFYEAEFVVAPHGAGLTNLVFCQPGARVLEITTTFRLYGYHCFYEIAHFRQLDYRALLGQPVNAREVDPRTGPGDSDIFTPPEQVVDQVHQMLATSRFRQAA